MMKPEWHAFASGDEAAGTLAGRIANIAAQAVAARGNALMAFAGGRTPIPFFQALKLRLQPDVASRLHITLTDERCVPATHPDSNERLLREHLLLPGMTFIPLHEEKRFEKPFDAVVLGMGEDGHTASLFPHHPQLAQAMARNAPDIIAIHHAPKPPPERLTFSARKLMETQHLFIHITGKAKRDLLQKANDSHPITAFLSHPKCEIFWAEDVV